MGWPKRPQGIRGLMLLVAVVAVGLGYWVYLTRVAGYYRRVAGFYWMESVNHDGYGRAYREGAEIVRLGRPNRTTGAIVQPLFTNRPTVELTIHDAPPEAGGGRNLAVLGQSA